VLNASHAFGKNSPAWYMFLTNTKNGKSMFLTRLVYVSTVTDIFKATDIEDILSVARKHNTKSSVTGMLCFNSQYFLQCIEGSRADINSTYHKILNDKRHTHIVMLDYKEVNAREFSDWSMGYMPESSFSAPMNLKYSGTREFSPYEMSGESAHLLMLSLRSSITS
jgi:hypothetical protein